MQARETENERQRLAIEEIRLNKALREAIEEGQKIDPEKVALAKLAEENAITIAEGNKAVHQMNEEADRLRRRVTEAQVNIRREKDVE